MIESEELAEKLLSGKPALRRARAASQIPRADQMEPSSEAGVLGGAFFLGRPGRLVT